MKYNKDYKKELGDISERVRQGIADFIGYCEAYGLEESIEDINDIWERFESVRDDVDY